MLIVDYFAADPTTPPVATTHTYEEAVATSVVTTTTPAVRPRLVFNLALTFTPQYMRGSRM